MARGCHACRCSDSLTFTEWPIVPRLPPFEKFKSARIHRGDAVACGFAPFPICLQACPPSLLPACPPPADAFSSHGSVCAAGLNFAELWWPRPAILPGEREQTNTAIQFGAQRGRFPPRAPSPSCHLHPTARFHTQHMVVWF